MAATTVQPVTMATLAPATIDAPRASAPVPSRFASATRAQIARRSKTGTCDDGDACTVESSCKQTGPGKSDCVGGKESWCACKTTSDCKLFEDGNLCNGTLYCHKAVFPWTCKVAPATVVACPKGQDKPCHLLTCDADDGKCKQVPMKNGTVCDDGDKATVGETCQQGICTASANIATCLDHGDCKDDGDKCNGLPYCNKAAKVCAINPATVITCPTGADSGCVKNQCIPKTGSCAMASVVNAAPCDDGDKCTLGDFCLNGSCKAGGGFACKCTTDKDCDDKDDGDKCNGLPYCNKSTGKCETNPSTVITCKTVDNTDCRKAMCVPKTGACELADVATGTGCNDGDACTKGETCDAGACKGTFVCGCNSNADCPDDGNLCNGVDYCDKSANPPSCKTSAAVPACKAATKGSCIGYACQPKTGKCAPGPVVAGTACDDGNPCTKAEFCQGVTCIGGVFTCECQTNADCAKKDDGDKCNGVDYCDKSGKSPKCLPNPASKVYCPKTSTSPCLVDACFPKTGQCGLQPGNAGAACDDGAICTDKDVCAAGKCAGKKRLCDDKNICTTDACDAKAGCQHKLSTCNDGNLCTLDKCDPKTGTCGFDAKAREGFICNADDDACTVNDVCAQGVCKAGIAAPCSLPTQACEVSKCIGKGQKTHKCAVLPKPDGVGCDDGKACKLGAACKSGKCAAGVKDRFYKRSYAPKTGEGSFAAALEPVSGGFVVAGRSGSSLAADGKADSWWIAAMAADGDLQWQLASKSDVADSRVGARAVVDPGDGQLVVLGSVRTNAGGMQGQGVWLKPSSAPAKAPTIAATKQWGDANGHEVVEAGAVSTGGGLLVAGSRLQTVLHPWLSQLSNIGQPQWALESKTVVQGAWTAAIAMTDGSWFVAGWDKPTKPDAAAMAAARITKNGKVSWHKRYGTPAARWAADAALISSNELAIVGWQGQAKAALPVQLRIDAAGKRLWDRLGTSAGYIHRAVASRGGGYTVAGGEVIAPATGNGDAFVSALDRHGNDTWQAAHDGGGNDRTSAILATNDGGVLAAGHVTTGGKRRGLLVRLGTFGHLGCDQAGGCQAKKLDGCEDGKPCTRDVCHGAKGCQHFGQPGAVCGRDGKCAAVSVCSGDKCVAGPDQKLFARADKATTGDMMSGMATADGGYAFAMRAGKAYRLSRYDRFGARLWTRTYSAHTRGVTVYGICARPGGGFVLVGGRQHPVYTYSYRNYAAGTDASGKLLWSHWGVNGHAYACRALLSGDVLVGLLPASTNDRSLLRLSAAGKLAWSQSARVYAPGQLSRESFYAMADAGGADTIAVGATTRHNGGYPSAWAVKLTPKGSRHWSRNYGPTRLSTVARTITGFVAVAVVGSKRQIVGLDAAGQLTWNHTPPLPAPTALQVRADGALLLAGTGTKQGKAALRTIAWRPGGATLFDRTTLLGFQTVPASNVIFNQADGGATVFGQAWIGAVISPAILRMDAFGHTSCGAVGKCGNAATLCNDNDKCTADACDGVGGCKHVASGHCEDGNACTTNTCTKKGTCLAKPVDCDDGSVCTKDTCTKVAWGKQGCFHTAIACNDSDPCTDNTCDAKKGCVFPSTKDGKVCTDSVCGGGPGQCTSGECVTLSGGGQAGCLPSTAKRLCADVLKANPKAATGWYWLDPDTTGPGKPRRMYCDMFGGWTRWVFDSATTSWITAVGRAICLPNGNNPGAFYGLGPYPKYKWATLGRIHTSLPAHSEIRQRFSVYAQQQALAAFGKYLAIAVDGAKTKPALATVSSSECSFIYANKKKINLSAHKRLDVSVDAKHSAKGASVVVKGYASNDWMVAKLALWIR